MLEIIIPLLGLLAVGTFRSSLLKVKRENDFVLINENMLFQIWNVINGIVIPLIVLFSNHKWYMAIIYYVVGIIFITNIISGFIINSSKGNSALTPFALNLITTILFIIYMIID